MEKIHQFFKENPLLATPYLVMDIDLVQKQYDKITKSFHFAKCHYAIKANPAREVISLLVKNGSSFDAASIAEINLCLELGSDPKKILFGNTIKKKVEIEQAYKAGIEIFVCDSLAELEKIASVAPNAKILFRIQTSEKGAAWPLSKKFGCSKELALELIMQSGKLGVIPYGLSFHAGSQQMLIEAWHEALYNCKNIFDQASAHGVELKAIDMGGGYPGTYRQKPHSIEEYGAKIESYLKEIFPGKDLYLMIEPGRYMVADTGIIKAEVVLISYDKEKDKRWVYLDVGKFTGFTEAEAIEYIITTDKDGTDAGKVVIAGPTCDSVDVIYEEKEYHLPMNLEVGDAVYFLNAGAYTTTYSSVAFNGFPPLKAYFA